MFKRKSRPKAAGDGIPASMEQASKGSSGYPAEVRVSALRERRLLMALRGISFGLILAVILNTVQAFIIVSMMPLKEIRPFLVQVAEEGTLVATIKPIKDTFEAKDVLTEKLVREYVVQRHEFLRSGPMMQSRWSPSGYIGTTTQSSEYVRFRKQVAPVVDELRASDAQRRATVLSVNAIQTGKIYVVDFRSTSYDKADNVIDERVYTVTMEIAFKPLTNLTKEQMIINPTGFTVVNYTLSEKDQ